MHAAAADPGPISALTVRVVNPPLKVPHATASGLVASFPMVLLDLHTRGGFVGRSYVFTYSMVFAPAVARSISPQLAIVAGFWVRESTGSSGRGFVSAVAGRRIS